jgi:hypothetical protein
MSIGRCETFAPHPKASFSSLVDIRHYGLVLSKFQVAARRLWNALPLSVRGTGSLDAFKVAAKTHLFKQCFIA